MTQTALDSYALANGYGKVTAKMTEAEKVSLRYVFVQDQLKNATGDFARTSDSWANQVRILNLQFDSLKATIGQGLINLFTPVIKVINSVIGRLSTLANAFKSFTELITGNKSQEGSGVGGIASDAASAAGGLNDAASAADKLSSATSAAGDAAEKAAKQALGLMGFDAINKIAESSSSSGGSGSSSGASSGAGSATGELVDYGSLAEGDTALDEVNSKFQGIIDRCKELQGLFAAGFNFGMGDLSVFDSIKDSITSIHTSLSEIVSAPDLKESATNLANSLSYNLGVVAGSFASVGATIGDNLLGGISRYLEEHSGEITQHLVNMCNIGTEISELTGEFSAAFAEVFEVFRSDDAKSITSDITLIFTETFGGVTELASKAGRDVLGFITQPFTDNKDSIKTALENTLSPLSTTADTVSEAWSKAWDEVQSLYDEHVKPLIDSLTDGISEIVNTLLDGYNEHIAPVLDKLSQKFKEVVENQVSPMITKFSEAMGSVFTLLKNLWETILQPLINWLAEKIMPVLSPIVELLGETFITSLQTTSSKLDTIFSGAKLIADTLSSMLTGIKDMIGSLDKLPKTVKLTFGAVKDAAWDKLKKEWDKFKDSKIVKTLKTKAETAYKKARVAWDKFKSGSATKSLKATGTNVLNSAKKSWDSLKSKSINLGLKLNGAVDNVKGTVNSIIDTINRNVIAKIKLTAPTSWPFIGGKTIGPPPNIPHLAQGGFVKANTPQLAVIGDNTRYGEIVAPENKLEAMARKAAQEAQNGDIQQVILLLQQIVQILLSLNLDIYMDGTKVTKRVIEIINQLTKTTGKPQILI